MLKTATRKTKIRRPTAIILVVDEDSVLIFTSASSSRGEGLGVRLDII